MHYLRNRRGLTLAEVMVGLAVSLILFTSLIGVMVGFKQIGVVNRHHLQAIQVARGMIETLRHTAFVAIVDSSQVVPFDAGPDQVFGTGDDLTGTLDVLVQDSMDMDDDGDTEESWIDIDGDGNNDQNAKPIQVSFTWTQQLLGQNRDFTQTINTLIAQ
jgi:type II secretory pathway pseudopilin PulG